MTKDQIKALSEHMNRPPWVIAVDAALRWSLDWDNPEEAYLVGRVWNLLKEWKHAEDTLHLTANQSLAKEYMKQLGYPYFETYQENAHFVLMAIYGDDDV